MKKLFTLLTAILFAGSMMAETSTSTLTFAKACGGSGTADDEVVWTVTSDAAESSFDNTRGIHYGTSNAPVTYLNLSTDQIVGTITKIVVNASGASGTTAKACVKVGDVAFKNGGNDTVALSASAAEYEFVGEAEGNILISLHHASATKKAIYCKSVVVTYVMDESAPILKANDLNLGIVRTENESVVIDTTLEVTAVNLTAPVTAETSSASIAITETELPATGGIFHLRITAPAGDFAETITLTSGEEEKVVNITGKVFRKMIAPGTPVKITAGSNATDTATVNGYAATKVGTAKNAGSASITVPANAIKLHFFAAAWNGDAGNISLASEDATLSKAEVTLIADAGIAGSTTNFELQDNGESSYYYVVDLSNVTKAAEIVLSSGSANRFVAWGATYELGDDPTSISNTATSGKAVKSIVNGQLVITRDGKSYNVLGTVVR